MFGSSIRIFYSSSFSDVYIDSDNEEDFGFLANTLSSAGMNFDRKGSGEYGGIMGKIGRSTNKRKTYITTY